MKETPIQAFIEGCNEALFLAFRESCESLSKTDIGEQFANYECDHPENKFRQTFKVQGTSQTHTPYAQCALLGCPIFERIKRPSYKESYSDYFIRFIDRLRELAPDG